MSKEGQWLTGDFTDVPKKEEHGLMAILLNFNQLRASLHCAGGHRGPARQSLSLEQRQPSWADGPNPKSPKETT